MIVGFLPIDSLDSACAGTDLRVDLGLLDREFVFVQHVIRVPASDVQGEAIVDGLQCSHTGRLGSDKSLLSDYGHSVHYLVVDITLGYPLDDSR